MKAKTRAMIILPVCLLFWNALEEVAQYKLAELVPNPYYRTGAIIVMLAFGFTLVGDFLSPWIAKGLEKAYKNTTRTWGNTLGVLIFCAVTMGAMYVLYFFIYIKGPQSVLPPAWR
jgi:hypothetical protein